MLKLFRSKEHWERTSADRSAGVRSEAKVLGTGGGVAGAGDGRAAGAGVGFRAVILEADDLGLLYAFNEGIRRAYQAGELTSTCVRANGYAYEHAIGEVLAECPRLGVGIHLCLNEGPSVGPLDRVPLLLSSNGLLRTGFRWLMKLAQTPEGREQIERELRAQIEKVLGHVGHVDHLNSHRHVHMIPEIFRITCRLASEYGIPCVRLVRELPHAAGGLRTRYQPLINSNYIKHVLLNWFARENESAILESGVATTDYFVGVNYTAHMTVQTIKAGLRAVPYGSVEVLLHPATGPDPRDLKYPAEYIRRYVAAPQREVEAQALRMPELSEFLHQENWVATNFSEWAGARRQLQFRGWEPEIPERVHEVCRTVTLACPLWVSEAQADSRAFAEVVMSQVRGEHRVLDLGTGTGILAICAAKLGFDVVAADVSGAAVRTARANAERNGVAFDCCRSDLLSEVEGRFDWIAFNLPYAFGRDTVATNVAKNLVRRVPWVRQTSGLAMPRTVLRYHQQLVSRLVSQGPEHLKPEGGIVLHAYESEVSALASVLPAGSYVELLHHAGLTNRTVGMQVRLPGR
jgi:chitin disaccharide deacetylase